ncbi:MAG: response regulator [Acidobacteriota bacterium]|nr:response regulator [Acidobacteriota bacterium]
MSSQLTQCADESQAERLGRCKRVLVVDDEPSARKLLALMLHSPSFECEGVGTSEEALVAIRRESFDVIVSDLRMPGMGGIGLIPEARRLQPYAAFLVTTGIDDVKVGVQAMRLGADDYLVKPLMEEAVLASVERALHKHDLEREIENYRYHLEDMVAERTAQLKAAIQSIEQSYRSTLEALGAAVELRDKETAGHSRRVSGYSLEIARRMAVPAEQLENLIRGAYLHDIGKLGIPDNILLKPGPLTADERKIMQQHVSIGFSLVKGIPFLEGAAEIVRTHHERFDGYGYPAGLKGEEIPLSGRIFAVVDALDAITSDRPYHRAASFEFAQDVIRCEAGAQFDPRVVASFLNVSVGTWAHIAADSPRMSS